MSAQYRSLPRKRLGFFPTPLATLDHLSERLGGPRILMKRDDQTGLASGGNKTRKLEFLIGEALSRGCDTVITGGAAQSNHCRQTAAAAAACGLKCHLVLGGKEPGFLDGNLLLDDLLGARIHWTGEFRKGEKIPEIVQVLESKGRKPYVIPYGGSNITGAIGFVEAVSELNKQLERQNTTVSHVIFASSSGGTQAGLIVGKSIFDHRFKLIGIGIDKGETGEGPFAEHVLKLTNATAKRLKLDAVFQLSDVVVREEFLGDGYGVVGDLERRAIRLTAETEGILLDPVYTGRAMGGLITMIEQGEFSKNDTVLFWHTGGMPALFSYAEELQR
jgi:D-cysteine desulfhydrase